MWAYGSQAPTRSVRLRADGVGGTGRRAHGTVGLGRLDELAVHVDAARGLPAVGAVGDGQDRGGPSLDRRGLGPGEVDGVRLAGAPAGAVQDVRARALPGHLVLDGVLGVDLLVDLVHG